jgi:hypothetical protein
MTIGKAHHKPAVNGFHQPAPAGHKAKAPEGGQLEQPQQLPGGTKYNTDAFEGGKHCKGHEGKKQGGHQKDPGGVTPPGGGTTPPAQGAYPTPPAGGTPPVGGTTPPTQGAYPTPPAGGTPPTQGTPPAGDPAVGTPLGLEQAVQEIASAVEKIIEALGGQPPEQVVPEGPATGAGGVTPPGGAQGAPAQNTGTAGAVQAALAA